MFGPNKGYLGIDIEPDKITLTQIAYEKKLDKPKLLTYGEIPVPRESTVQDHANAIRDLMKTARASSQKAVISLANWPTVFHQIRLPYNMSERDIPDAVKERAREEIGEEVTGMAVGWSVLDHYIKREKDMSVNESASAWDILFVATPMDEITMIKEVAKKARLTLVAPEVKAAALSRVLDLKGKKQVAIIHTESDWRVDVITLRNKMLESKQSFETIDEAMPLVRRMLESGEWSLFASGSGTPLLREHIVHGESDEDGQQMVIDINPWKGMLVPNGLEERLKVIGPTMAVSVGLAMREIVAKE